MKPINEKIILFDGVCNLCNGTVRFIIKRDPNAKFKFASLQSEFGQSFLKEVNLPTIDFDSFVYIKDDQYFLKSSAALHLVKELTGFWKLLYIFIILPRPVRDLAYSVIAKTRYQLFGKQERCEIPTPDIRRRFLG
jgi:predicted DCC family thiol-disulfide oxidoreductase YuxK